MTSQSACFPLGSVFLMVLALFAIVPLRAAPPAKLTGLFIELGGDRLEFDEELSGIDGDEPFDYTYEVLDGLSAELVVEYASSRLREITLSFLSDGAPNGYQEFDFASTEVPVPPAFRSGAFAVGELEVDPPTESAAPESLVGLFLRVSGKRLEFLTPNSGRCFLPGASEYFYYEYSVEDDSAALVEIFYDDGVRELSLSLVFDAFGAPVSYVSKERRDGSDSGGSSGFFSMGANLHLADLKVGFGISDLRGDDIYFPSGKRQTVSKRVASTGTLVFPFALENDGDDDSFRLRAARGRGRFKVAYFGDPGRKNLTGAMTTGRYATGILEHLDEVAFTLEVKPLRPGGTYRGRAEARSQSVDAARDRIDVMLQVKRKQAKVPGKLTGRK